MFGHENLGQVVEAGDAVQRLKGGEWVCLPFNVACGFCVNGAHGLTNYCLTAQPLENMAGAAYRFADMGPWQGRQAGFLRVPWADVNALRLPEDAEELQDDYVMVADISCQLAGKQSATASTAATRRTCRPRPGATARPTAAHCRARQGHRARGRAVRRPDR